MTVTDISTTCVVVTFGVKKMTTAQVVEMSVTVNNNSPIQGYVHLDDQTQPTFEITPAFTRVNVLSLRWLCGEVVISANSTIAI